MYPFKPMTSFLILHVSPSLWSYYMTKFAQSTYFFIIIFFIGPGRKCTDRYPGCAAWARAGQCRTNPAWMDENCKKSCRSSNCDNEPVRPAGQWILPYVWLDCIISDRVVWVFLTSVDRIIIIIIIIIVIIVIVILLICSGSQRLYQGWW